MAGKRKAADYFDLAPWDEACEQIYSALSSRDLVIAELKRRLVSGKFEAVDCVFKDGKVKQYDLPPKWWKTVQLFPRSGSTTRIDWHQSDKPKLPGGAWVAIHQHNIFLRRDGLNTFWPTRSPEPTGSPEPTNAIASPDRRPPGPMPKHDWKNQLIPELIRIIYDEGLPETDAVLIKKLSDFCYAKWRWTPDHLPRWVSHALRRIR